MIILEQEINMAVMSNSIKFEGEEYSIFQAHLMSEKANYLIEFHGNLRDIITASKANASVVKFQVLNISRLKLTQL
jgi:hypothetical protein